MKCDQCDNEATVHEVTVRNGVKIEKHLCESCAANQGIAAQAGPPVGEFLKQYSPLVPGAPVQRQQPTQSCPTCKMTFAEFRQHGVLGCADCYRAFEAQLGPLLERAHESAVKHVGKVPRRLLGGQSLGETQPPRLDLEERAERLRRIRRELDNAVQAEKYELAAKLRDELRRMNEPRANP